MTFEPEIPNGTTQYLERGMQLTENAELGGKKWAKRKK